MAAAAATAKVAEDSVVEKEVVMVEDSVVGKVVAMVVMVVVMVVDSAVVGEMDLVGEVVRWQGVEGAKAVKNLAQFSPTYRSTQ